MSFASTIVLKDAAAANENFLRLFNDSSKVNYVLSTATLSAPVQLVIGHQMASSQDGVDRHMIKITRTVPDSNDRPRTLILNCTVSMPRLGITRANLNDAIAELKEFLGTANVDALLRGEL